MRFIEHGPSIPDDLLIARDAGDVIFFCGAGVSRAYAELPGFPTLTETVLDELGAARKSPARRLLNQAQYEREIIDIGALSLYDHIFGLLEREFDACDIRGEIIRAIRPREAPNLSAHSTLLDLSMSRDGRARLVTTNFDLLFEASRPSLIAHGPPRLPDPKADDFGGIIHLHGRADSNYNGTNESEEFVISSADFGRAYLADGWATQFMRALLERFVVVFVGYTANDPPIRYLLEALNTHPGGRSQLYAFQSGTDPGTLAMWEHRGVHAISYDAPAQNHALLWETLDAWAERARNPDCWYDNLLRQAAQGPDKVSAHVRGQIAHLMSTREGAREIASADPPLPASWLLVADPRQRYRAPGRKEFHNEDSPIFDPFQVLCLDTDALPETVKQNDARSFGGRKAPPDAWDGFAANKHDIGAAFGNLRGHDSGAPAKLSPRLRDLSVWLWKIAHDPLTLWWSGQQEHGLHPSVIELISNRLLNDREEVFSAEIRRGWKLLLEAWSDRRPPADMAAVALSWQAEHEGWNTRLVRDYAALFRPKIEIDSLDWPGATHPLLWKPGACPELIVGARVEYPRPHNERDIPDELIGYAVRIFRGNLELAEALEQETGHNQLYLTTTYANKDESSSRSDTYGLAGPIVHLQQLMEQFGRADPEGAKAEIQYWQGHDGRIFARLKLWAAASDLTTGVEAARILTDLPDDIFWEPNDRPDVLHALRANWQKLEASGRRRIEQRLLTTSFPWPDNMGDPQGYFAFNRLIYLHALSDEGIEFSFDLEAKTKELQRQAPEWRPQMAEDATASNAPKVEIVIRDLHFVPLLGIPITDILDKAAEITGQHALGRWASAPFKGLSEVKPARAFAALRHAAACGQVPETAWQDFLWCPQRENDSRRLACAICHLLCALGATKLANIAYSAAHWMGLLKERLHDDLAEELEPLWNAILDALRKESRDERRSHNENWAHLALNAPIGRLVDILLADPALPNPADGTGLSVAWKRRTEQLISLPEGLRCQALVLLGQHIVYLYAADSQWVVEQIIPVANSQTEAANALWEGILWSANIPRAELLRSLKPGLFYQARSHRREGPLAANIAGFLLHGWAGVGGNYGEAVISDEEFREVLIDANDDVRKGSLQYLQCWLEQQPEQWRDLVFPFFQNVWPRQRALKTEPLSQAVMRFILSSDDLFPELVDRLKSRLVPLRDGDGWVFLFSADEADMPVKKYPRETLDLLWSVLPEGAFRWGRELEMLLPLLEGDPRTGNDPRLSEIRRRLAQ